MLACVQEDRPRSPSRPRRRRGLRSPVRALVVAWCALVVAATVLLDAAVIATPDAATAVDRATGLTLRRGDAPPLTPVPERFAAALVATEDAHFYSHHGVDPRALARNALAVLTGSSTDPGGATLDQQLAKQLYFGGKAGGPWTTLQQLVIGMKIDAGYPKRQILELYAAVVYFGNGYYGLTAAAQGFFHRTPDELDWGQAAMLAGLVQAPSADNPVADPARARARQHVVLGRLVDVGALTPAQARAAAAAPLGSG